MRYLVATDGSEESEEAIRHAARDAEAFDASIEIAHVLTPETELVDGQVILPGEDAAIEAGERTVARGEELAASVVEDQSVDIETELLTGLPAAAIATRAEEIDADRIYVGHRGLSGEHERVVGSVAKSVVDRASVPVTIIR